MVMFLCARNTNMVSKTNRYGARAPHKFDFLTSSSGRHLGYGQLEKKITAGNELLGPKLAEKHSTLNK